MQPLMELGIDSFGALDLQNMLEQAFAITLPATLAYDYPTASALAKYISEVLHTIVIQQHTHMGKTANDQDVILIQERLRDIAGSILGTSISVDQVLTPTPCCKKMCFVPLKRTPTLMICAQPLMEAGLGSLEALEFQMSVAETFDIKVLPTLVFDYPTLKSMAQYLASLKASSKSSTSADLWAAPKLANMRPSGNHLTYIMGVSCRYPGGAFSKPP